MRPFLLYGYNFSPCPVSAFVCSPTSFVPRAYPVEFLLPMIDCLQPRLWFVGMLEQDACAKLETALRLHGDNQLNRSLAKL